MKFYVCFCIIFIFISLNESEQKINYHQNREFINSNSIAVNDRRGDQETAIKWEHETTTARIVQYPRKSTADSAKSKPKIILDVIQNITRVNNELEELIKNYEKLKNMYKSGEFTNDEHVESTDMEVDETFREKNKRAEEFKLAEVSSTRDPIKAGTEMFLFDASSEAEIPTKNPTITSSKTHPSDDDSDSDENNKEINNNQNTFREHEDKTRQKSEEIRAPPVQHMIHKENFNNNLMDITSSTKKVFNEMKNLNEITLLRKKPELNSETITSISDSSSGEIENRKGLGTTNKIKTKGNTENKKEHINSSSESSSAEILTGNGMQVRFKTERRLEENKTKHANRSKLKTNIVRSKKLHSPVKPILRAGPTENKNNDSGFIKSVIHVEPYASNYWAQLAKNVPVHLETEKEIIYDKSNIIKTGPIKEPLEANFRYQDDKNLNQNTLLPQIATNTSNVLSQHPDKVKKVDQTTVLMDWSAEDDKNIVKEQFKTSILRKAYGDACLKVVVKKCYKACKQVPTTACIKYDCKEDFKNKFKESSKTGCIKEFRDEYAVQDMNRKTMETDNYFVDIMRNGYLAAACLPPKNKRKSFITPNNTSKHTDHGLNILRDRFEAACQKASAEKCKRACYFATKEVCETADCRVGKKSTFAKECRAHCKKAFRYEDHDDDDDDSDIYDSETGSDESDSESEGDFSGPDKDFEAYLNSTATTNCPPKQKNGKGLREGKEENEIMNPSEVVKVIFGIGNSTENNDRKKDENANASDILNKYFSSKNFISYYKMNVL